MVVGGTGWGCGAAGSDGGLNRRCSWLLTRILGTSTVDASPAASPAASACIVGLGGAIASSCVALALLATELAASGATVGLRSALEWRRRLAVGPASKELSVCDE